MQLQLEFTSTSLVGREMKGSGMTFAIIALTATALIGFLLYIYFGPRSWLLAFIVGGVVAGGLAWFAMRYYLHIPPNLSTWKDQAGAAHLKRLLAASSDPEQTLRELSERQRLIATLLFGVPASYFTLKAMWQSTSLFGSVAKDMTATGLLGGSLAGLAVAAWSLVGRS